MTYYTESQNNKPDSSQGSVLDHSLPENNKWNDVMISKLRKNFERFSTLVIFLVNNFKTMHSY
jgi:hypothetical protein